MTSSTTTLTTPTTANNPKHRLTLFINPALIKHARAQAVIEDLTLTQLVAKSLLSYLPTETIIKKIDLVIINKRKQ